MTRSSFLLAGLFAAGYLLLTTPILYGQEPAPANEEEVAEELQEAFGNVPQDPPDADDDAFDKFFSSDVEPEPAQRWLLKDM